jgi:uncharacterized protein (DUF3820 family)
VFRLTPLTSFVIILSITTIHPLYRHLVHNAQMSSDYGSDIASDDVDVETLIESSAPSTQCALPATPVSLLKTRDINAYTNDILIIPPPSQPQPQYMLPATPASVGKSLGGSYPPASSQSSVLQKYTSGTRRDAPATPVSVGRTVGGAYPPSSFQSSFLQPASPISAAKPLGNPYPPSSSQSFLQKYTSATPPEGCYAPTTPVSATQPVVPSGPYRFTFGSHKGKTLDEVPDHYIDWLKRKDIANSRADLKDALEEWEPRQPIKQVSPPSQSLPRSSQGLPNFPSSQPTPTQCRLDSLHAPTSPAVDSPLYRLPLGIHKGMTLLEVPENYLQYLRLDQNMANMMPGLGYALSQLNEGKSPTAAPPQPVSQQSLAPLSSPAAQLPTSLRQILQAAGVGSQASQPPTGLPSEYRFDFGKHIGKVLADVPADYISFLKERGIVGSKPDLAAAIVEHERQSSISNDPADYRLNFGMHNGKPLSLVPEDYIEWLKTTNRMGAENPSLRAALAYHDECKREQEKKTKRGSKAKKPRKNTYTPNDISMGTGSISDRYPFQKNGEHLLITPKEAQEYFGVGRSAHIERVPMRNKYVALHSLKDVYYYARDHSTCKGETPTNALKRWKRECSRD